MQRGQQRGFPQFVILIKGDGELEDAVVEQNRREHIDMFLFQFFSAESLFQLTVEPQG